MQINNDAYSINEFTDVKKFIEWVQIQKRFSKKENLDKIRYYCKLLNHPENKFKSIHITGTNGKGSTVAMLRSIFMHKGLNVATYTSPYITCFNERIGYNGENITDEDLLKYANIIIKKYPKIISDGVELPTFFEFVTLIAFQYFADIEELDVAIIEVGMGGRLDATNVISPILSIVTNVAYDHMQVLGDSLEAILNEKLGIVKDNIPVICGIKNKDLQMICQNVATLHNTIAIFPNYEKLIINQCDINENNFSYNDIVNLKVSLLGFHQIDNALVVIEAYNILKTIFNLNIIDLKEGLMNTKWIGRLEVVSSNPYILIDGSHNIDGVTRICEFVKKLKFNNKRAVISISHDKEVESMIKLVDQTFDEVIFTKYQYARSADADVLYDLSSCNNKKILSNINDAIDEVYKNPSDITIFMGSLYLVSEVRALLKGLN